MLMAPASPIISFSKKLRSRSSRGASMDGLRALSGLDDSGEFLGTPVGFDATRIGDGEVSCAGSDGISVESGESVEEGGGGTGAGTAAAAGGGAGGEDNHTRPKPRVGKLARGLSYGIKRIKQKRQVGASGSMTVNRASFMGDGDNSYLRAHDVDGEGARSFAGGWGKRASSPERKIPQEWELPMANIPASSSSATHRQGQGQDEAVFCSSSNSHPASPLPSLAPVPSPTKSTGMPPAAPQMQRGLTEPCTAQSSARSISSPRQEDLAELGREFGSEDAFRTPGTATASTSTGGYSVQEHEGGRSRGRDKSKSLSPKGQWEGIRSQGRSASAERGGDRERERSRSSSPRRRFEKIKSPFRSRPQSPQSPQSPQASQSPQSLSSVQEGRVPGAGGVQGSHQEPVHGSSNEEEGRVSPLLDNTSEAPTATAAEISKATANLQKMLHEKRDSEESINSKPKPQEREEQLRTSPRPQNVAEPKLGCDCVPAAPPSELKYGDRLRLWVRLRSPSRSHHRLAGGSDVPLHMPADIWHGQKIAGKGDSGAGTTPTDSVLAVGGGGYVGSLVKVQRVSKKLFRRSELAMIGQPEGNTAGFAPCHFKAVDPENKHREGDVVRYNDAVLLVDDRGNVWTDNAHLLPGSLRMKARGSKRQITVAFKPFLAKADDDNLYPPVVFGTQELQILTMDHGHKDSGNRKRRGSSKKSFLTAFSKKNSGGSNVAGAFLCSDGRGEAIAFEVHLPNASPVGDPSPVVTKVTIHVDEQTQHQKRLQQGSTAPPLHPHTVLPESKSTTAILSLEGPVRKSTWPGDAPTAPLTPSTGNVSSVDGGNGDGNIAGSDNGVGTEIGGGMMEEREKPRRPKSMGKRLLKNVVHKRRSSLTHSRSGSFAGGILDGRVSRTNASGAGRSPTNADAASGADDDLSEDGDASSEGEMVMGAFEGLKWNEYVQFKMPAEGEVEPNDPLLTLRLSNRFTATLTSKQLRDNAGLGKFPVKASKMKGARGASESSGDVPNGSGVVYLRCTLTPIVCPGAEEAALHAQPEKLPSADEQAAGKLGERLVPRALHAWLPKQGETSSMTATASWVMDRAFGKPDTSDAWPRVFKSTVLVLVLAAALLSMSIIRTNFSSSSMSMSATPGFSRSLSATHSKAASSSPSPCTSVWDIRRPDGTAYPHNQLSAAAAVLDSVDFEDKSANVRKYRNHQQGSSEDASGSGTRARPQAIYPGGGRATATTATAAGAAKAATARLPLVPGEVDGDGDGVVRALAGKRADNGQGYGQGDVGGVGLRAVAGAIGFAAVAVVVVLMKGLFGLWSDPTQPEPPAPSSPMQAQVHLLGWDDRRMSEAARTTEDIDNLYYPPPSGSSLEPMPHRFLLAESMDVAKAWARWETTLEWRKETNADNVLNKPHPRFALIKSKYAHCFHLPDKGGRVTYYERPGMSDFAEMRKVGITKADLLDHYVYCMEYLWQVLQPRQSQRITIIIDLAGVKFRDLVGESLAFLKTSVGMMSRHYPQRSFKIMILNAPSFFNSVFALVKPMLNEATKKKIDLLPVANVGEEMLKVIPADHVPLHYGGTGEAALGESPAELALLSHVQKVLQENGQTMQTS